MATSKTLTPTNVTIQIPAFTDQPDQRVNSNCIDKEADAINALNTKISDFVQSKLLPDDISSTSHTLNVPSGSGHLLIIYGGALRSGIYIVSTASNGTVTIAEAFKASTLSSVASGQANKLTITFGSASTAKVMDFVFGGNMCSF